MRGHGVSGESSRAFPSVLESGISVHALESRVPVGGVAPNGQAAVGARIPATADTSSGCDPIAGCYLRCLAARHHYERNIGVNPVTTKPWQIVALATLCFIQAVYLLTGVLEDLMISANPASVNALAEMGLKASDSGPDVAAVYDYLQNSQHIVSIIAVVMFMFGFLLYRGEYLPAVRLTGTIFLSVGLIGRLLSPGTDSGTPLDTELADLMVTGFAALLLVGFVALFFGKSAQWVKEHANS